MVRVKGHYRHLKNGTLVHIDEYTDKRQKALASPHAFRGAVVHADPQQTTMMSHAGKLESHPHTGEMTKPQIHAHLNKPLPVNAELAHHVVKHQLGIRDHGQFLRDLVEDEGMKPKPRFEDEKGAAKWFHETHVAPKLKELREAHGKTTTRAKAYGHKANKDLKRMWDEHADDPDAPPQLAAEGKALQEHADEANDTAEELMAQGAAARSKTVKDAPKIAGLAPGVRFYGHQAEALAKMSAVKASPLDVDMGGGKGLLLPADALALMTAGKIKKPLIVVPDATIDINAGKLAEQYSAGGINVMKISTKSINAHGGIAGIMAEIDKAPPNTVFMASYDAVAAQDREGGPERFPHAAALSAAGFDYLACDECHNLGNEDSARFQAVAHLGNADYRRMASGTFLANDPRSLVGPLKLLFPAMDLDQKKLEEFYGRSETAGEANWSPDGLKRLREHLLDLGMVSLRKSAWMDQLPKRKDALSVVQMHPEQKRIYDAALDDTLDRLEAEAKENPLLARALADGSLDNAEEAPPALQRKLEMLQGITDYPDEMAKLVEGKLQLVGGEDAESAEAVAELAKMSPAARNAMLGLKGMVSPKAVDVYAKARAHLAKKGNGKFIVFMQRKAAARHVMEHMPPELAQHAAYFDASKMGDLGKFTDSDEGPRILVAVDASIKEGVDGLQRANGLYRYDHHLTPANQDQSIARVDRLGQSRDVDVHLGIMDGGMDVAKYARLCSKGWTNAQVVSDFEGGKKAPIFKLSVQNLRTKRDASILDRYHGMSEEIRDWQRGENKKYREAYGSQPYDLSADKPLEGSAKAAGKAYHKPKLKKAYAVDLDGMADGFARRILRAAGIRKAFPKNWSYRQPAHVGSGHGDIGTKITDLPEEKLARVQEIVQDAVVGKDSEDRLARRLRAAVNSGGHSGDDRDWHRVARTEIANARSHAALDHIIASYGEDALVVRSTSGCCGVCCNAFGRYVRRKWRAGSIPDKYKGAVHPNCKCGPWQLVNPVKRLAMQKAVKLAVEEPMGLVRRRVVHEIGPDGRSDVAFFELSTGHGRWVPMDSLTARAVMRAVLARCPLVLVEPGERGGLARIGHGVAAGKILSLLDPLRVMGARYYAAKPDPEDGQRAELAAKTRDDFIAAMLQVLPVVATMPELWPQRRAMIALTDCLGQKTLTDWWAFLPTGQPAEALLATEPAGIGSARGLVRLWNKRLLARDSLKKG